MLASVPVARFLRFATSGGMVALVYMAITTGLLQLGVAVQLSLIVGYLAGLVLNFSLNRQFVFVQSGEFAQRLSAQALRFLVVALLAYGVTAIALAVLPEALDISPITVFIVVTIIVSAVNFLILRAWVFHRSTEG
jgi:putative flippase GtrA